MTPPKFLLCLCIYIIFVFSYLQIGRGGKKKRIEDPLKAKNKNLRKI